MGASSIEALYALVTVTDDGEEQVIVDDATSWLMVAVEDESLAALRDVRPVVAERLGRPVSLVRFKRED